MQHRLNSHRLRLMWVGLCVLGLITCQPKDAVLPGVARIQVLLARNEPQLPFYFLEDSTHNQLTLEVYYFDANNAFVQPKASPQFLVNGRPLPSNTYTFNQAGQFTFSARIGNRNSDNQLLVNVGSVASKISRFTLKTAVPFLNADSVSRLPLMYELADQQGRLLNLADYPPVNLSVNGVPRIDKASLTASQAGEYVLQATFLGKLSNVLLVTARKPLRYDLVRLPVIIHVLNSAQAAQINPTAILADVTNVFRRNKPATDPNQADAYLEFVPASADPDGHPLAIAGLDVLGVDNPSSVDTAVNWVNQVIHRWCPQHYINVFVSLDWVRQSGPGYSYTYVARNPAGTPITCEQSKPVDWPTTEIGAIYIYDEKSMGSLAHELGHFLRLAHAFRSSCAELGSGQPMDIPHYLQVRPNAEGLKYTCDGVPFTSQYVMDYYVAANSFTYEQVSAMRQLLNWASYVPYKRPSGQPSKALPNRLERGEVIACPGLINQR